MQALREVMRSPASDAEVPFRDQLLSAAVQAEQMESFRAQRLDPWLRSGIEPRHPCPVVPEHAGLIWAVGVDSELGMMPAFVTEGLACLDVEPTWSRERRLLTFD